MTTRQAFEKWVSRTYAKNTDYKVLSLTSGAWSTWKAATAAALERAAEVCETILDEISFANAYECANECAEAIRALKEQQ